MLELPIELQREVLFHLKDDKLALRYCAIAHRDLTYPCQHYIFSHIVFVNESNGELLSPYNGTVTRFKHLLKKSPHLGLHVQSLKIRGRTDYRERIWTEDDIDSLTFIIALLKNLQAFTLECHDVDVVGWTTRQVFECVGQLLQINTLTSVHFSGVPSTNFIQSAGPNLKHVWLNSAPDESQFRTHSFEDRFEVSLESLYLQDRCDSSSLVKSLRSSRSSVDISHLKKLVVARDPPCISAQAHVWSLLQLCLDSLEEFVFVPGYCHFIDQWEDLRNYEEPIDLGQLSALRRILLDIDMGDRRFHRSSSMDHEGRGSLEGWVGDLQGLSTLICRPSIPCSSLEEIILDCRIFDASVDEDDALWDRIVKALLSNLYPSLSRLNVRIVTCFPDEEAQNALVLRFSGAGFINALKDNTKIAVNVCRGENLGWSGSHWPSWFE